MKRRSNRPTERGAKAPPGRRPGGLGTGSRRRILEAAERLFLRKGYGATSMRNLAGETRLGLSSLYNHFRGKEEIFDALIELRSPVREIEALVPILDGDDLIVGFREFCRTLEGIIDRNTSFIRLTDIDGVEFSGRKTRRTIREIRAKTAAPILAVYEKLRTRGVIRDFDPAVGLPFVVLLLASIFVLRNRFGPAGLLSRPHAGEDRALGEIVDIVLFGIVRRPGTDEGPSKAGPADGRAGGAPP